MNSITIMKSAKTIFLIIGVVLTGLTGWGKTVGVWRVAPLCKADAMVKTLEEAGWRVVTLGNTNVADGAVLANLDVLILAGGWDAYRLAGFRARRNLVKFVAGGKGLMDGYVRNDEWPLFPQVGVTTDYGNGKFVSACGTNGLAKIIEEQFALGNKNYLRVNPGRAGSRFAAMGEDAVGVYGEVYGGRYVLFGADLNSMEVKKKDLEGGVAQQLFLACVDWLAAAPALTAAEKARQQSLADLEFLRMEKQHDWAVNKTWECRFGLVPEIRSRLTLPLERRRRALEQLSKKVSGENLARCQALTVELQQVVKEIDGRYQKVLEETQARIQKMEPVQLLEDNPFVDLAGVLKKIESVPGKTDEEKAEMLALVKRCATEDLPDVPQRVVLYLQGNVIAERLLPADQFRELTARSDKCLAEMKLATTSPGGSKFNTVPERLRNDPLMVPYYTGTILPTPQKAEYRDEFISMAKVAIVVGNDVVEPGALVELLTDRITRYGGQASVVTAPGAEHTAVISLGDTALARQVQAVPAVPDRVEGYVVYCTRVADKPLIILKGRDRLGMTWSIASLMQLIHWRDGQTLARAATVVDYPTLARRGIILHGDGFFNPARDRKGNIISYPDTDMLLKQNRLFLLVCKINEPFYNSMTVADCYDHYWKHPDKMPVDAHIPEDLEAMGQSLSPLGITWWGGISPHGAGDSSPDELSRKVTGDDESVNGLLYFGRLMEKSGGHLSIILDDIRFPLSPYDQEHYGTGRLADTWYITRVMAQLKKEFPKARLLVCPPFYFGPVGKNPYNEDRDEYLKTIGEEWSPDIEVFWTGRQVNAATLATKEYTDWWTGLTKRKPYFWQNCCTFWCHMYRRHFPTDPLNALWQENWDGLFDVLGWYGFNGNGIGRMCVTDAISADFQWNPQAYGKDKHTSAERSVRESAEKFIGQGSWPLLMNVTTPLGYFDDFYCDDPKDVKAQEFLNQKAARTFDIMVAKQSEVMSAFKILSESFPAAVRYWSALGEFIGVSHMADIIKSEPSLRLYRAVGEQRKQAVKAGHYTPDRDLFFAAADIAGGWLQEITVDDLEKRKLQPAMVLEGPKRNASMAFPLTKAQVGESHEVLLKGRQNASASRLTLKLNGKPIYDGKAPFGKMESTAVRVPVPGGILVETNNVLSLSLMIEDNPAGGAGDDLDGMGIGGGPPLAINYIVFKTAGNLPSNK